MSLNITKEQFDAASNKFPSTKWVKLGFKYFSKSTKPEDAYVKKTTTIVLVALFILMMIGGFVNIPMSIMIYPIIIYSVIIFGLAGYMLAAVLTNNSRIKKIAKELGVSIEQYQFLLNMFYPET
jgi:hypothetical protein